MPSASILSTTPRLLSSTALLRQGLRQIAAAGLPTGLAPASVGNTDLRGSREGGQDLGGLRTLRENALRFWQAQQDPLSLVAPTSGPRRRVQAAPTYACLPLLPARVFVLARSGHWSTPAPAPPPRAAATTAKQHAPGMALEGWLSEFPIPAWRNDRHPLGMIGPHGLPFLERNVSQAGAPWPSRTSTSVASGTVARAIRLWHARETPAIGTKRVTEGGRRTALASRSLQEPDAALASCDDRDGADQAEACARRINARHRQCPDMARLDDLLRGLIPKPSARYPHPPHFYPTRPQKSELHPFGIHRALVRARG